MSNPDHVIFTRRAANATQETVNRVLGRQSPKSKMTRRIYEGGPGLECYVMTQMTTDNKSTIALGGDYASVQVLAQPVTDPITAFDFTTLDKTKDEPIYLTLFSGIAFTGQHLAVSQIGDKKYAVGGTCGPFIGQVIGGPFGSGLSNFNGVWTVRSSYVAQSAPAASSGRSCEFQAIDSTFQNLRVGQLVFLQYFREGGTGNLPVITGFACP